MIREGREKKNIETTKKILVKFDAYNNYIREAGKHKRLRR